MLQPIRLLILTLLPNLFQTYVQALRCHQCNGWNGYYPPDKVSVSTCDNRNNQCYTTQYCVKVIDPMRPTTRYVTFKSDCYFQTTIQVSPTNLSYVSPGRCYPFQDGSEPVKRWYYCFCNDRDFCNESSRLTVSSSQLFFTLITPFLILIFTY